MQKHVFVVIGFILFCSVVFFQFFLKGYLPIPSDSLVGLYHPFRDLYSSEYPNGVPYKNFLITDPVRQQYPWRYLAIGQIKDVTLPLWNPYTFAGTPLLGNIQSAPLYPLNVLFFILPFEYSWSVLVFLQPVLMGLFLYIYLRFIKLSLVASLFAAISYAFSGFSVSWMEWNTVIHTALWLPLILLSIEKLFFLLHTTRLKAIHQKTFLWSLIFILSLSSSVFAGHLQTFFYLFVVSVMYTVIRSVQLRISKKEMILLVACYIFVVCITSFQLLPALQFIQLSARGVDQIWTQEGWFIPWQHLVQFIAPDFFGNPTTLNYFGTWNYAELVGYIGLIPLSFALYAIFFVRRKMVYFFLGVLVISLIFSLDTPIARLPFTYAIPFLSTSQPTRLLFLVDFSLVILTAFGIDAFIKRPKRFFVPLLFIGICIGFLWLLYVLNPFSFLDADLQVAKRNLYLPSILFLGLFVSYIFLSFVKDRKMMFVGLVVLLLLSSFDSVRFAQKFLSFSPVNYLYPETRALEFLQNQTGLFRVMSLDSRILPPNTSIMYGISTIEGYDPLYLRRFGELMVAFERGRPDISPPFGFNRIITPKSIDREFLNVLGIKYMLSLTEIKAEGINEVFKEGSTIIYENENVFDRAFSITDVVIADSDNDAIEALFENKSKLADLAIVENYAGDTAFARAEVTMLEYSPNKVSLRVSADGDAFIVLMDSFYPTWAARIKETNEVVPIYRTNYNFRGIVVREGTHIVEFTNTLFGYGY